MKWLAMKNLHCEQMRVLLKKEELDQCHFEFHSHPLPKMYGDHQPSYVGHCCIKESHRCSTHPEHLHQEPEPRGTSKGQGGSDGVREVEFGQVKHMLDELKQYVRSNL